MTNRLSLQTWPIDRLREYENNPRRNDHVVAEMARQISEFGFRVPIIAKSDGEIVDGHLRLKAARELGLESVPVLLADDLTEEQIKAFRIAVNKTSEWAQWDIERLTLELQELDAAGFDLELTGFGNFLGLDDPSASEWTGMPEMKQEDKSAFRSLIVHFKDQAAVDDFAQLLEQPIGSRVRFIWYPPAEIERYSDKAYAVA